MKHLFTITVFLCAFSLSGQNILVPHDLKRALLDDSCFVVGGLHKGMLLELYFDDSGFWSRTLDCDTGMVQLRELKDSLMTHFPSVALYWKQYKELPPGKYRLTVTQNDEPIATRTNIIGLRPIGLDPIFRIDSLSFTSSSLAKNELLHFDIVAPFSGGLIVSDTLTRSRSVGFDYALFRKNTPHIIRYRLRHASGIWLSDTAELKLIPNRALRHDSLKKVLKQQRVRLKNEITAQSAGLFDSLKTPTIPPFGSRPTGMVEVGYGTFRGQNSLFPPNDFFQLSGNTRMNAFGIPLTAQVYFFENGIDFYSRRDFRLSFDYQAMVHNLEAKKEQLQDVDLDSYKNTSQKARLNSWKDEARLDTAKYSAILQAKKDSLIQTKAIEAALQKRIQAYKQKLEDTLVNDSTRAEIERKQQRISNMKDSLGKTQQEVARIEAGINKVKQIKNRYAKGLPADSLMSAEKAALEARVSDSLGQYMNIDKYIRDQESLTKYEDEYKTAKELYDKLKRLRQFDIGVVTPYRSPFSLSGIALRGVSAQYDLSGQTLGFTGGRMVQSPFLMQTLYNVVSVSDRFNVMKMGEMEVVSTNFWRDGRFQSISEMEARTEAWKGWQAEVNLAHSLSEYNFSNEVPSEALINKYNSVVVGALSKNFMQGKHSVEGRYKYVPASFNTPGNPFLINDIEAYTMRFNNSLLKQSMNSYVEVEWSTNNTLEQLPATDYRRSIFSLQQLDLSESFQLTVLNSAFRSNGFNEQGFNMHDVSLGYFQDFWGNMLSASLGFMHQQFSNAGLLINQTSMLKGDVAFSKKGNRLALAYLHSVPIGESTKFTTMSSSLQKNLLKGSLKTSLRFAYNKVELMHPRISYGASVSAKVYKSVNLVLDFQGNSLLIAKDQFYNNSSMGVVKLNTTF